MAARPAGRRDRRHGLRLLHLTHPAKPGAPEIFRTETRPDGIATVTLANPKKHNAFDDHLIAQLTSTFRTLGETSAVRGVILQAEGPSFSAGADLAWMQRMATFSPAENIEDAARLAGLMRTLDRLPKPTLALVQGAAYGGGVGLVACCDIAIAADTARFCLSEVKIGLIPAAIGPYVINAIGARQARRYFTTAEIFTAAQAQSMGLVHQVVPPADLPAARDAITAAWLQAAPAAQAEAKALVFLCEAARLDDALADETGRRIAARRASPEGREGLAAFLERRPPAWAPPKQGPA